ncbi:MAG: RNA polymerase sigma factor, partial [Pedobacter sp.]
MNTVDFSQQICNYRTALMQSAMKFTQNQEDADDLVQETLIKAIRYESKFIDGTNLSAWLYTILKNTFINHYRSCVRKSAVITRSLDFDCQYPATSCGTNGGEGKFMMEDMNKALKNLNPTLSLPFLRYFEGYKYHEIAEEINIPIGTVKTRIH